MDNAAAIRHPADTRMCHGSERHAFQVFQFSTTCESIMNVYEKCIAVLDDSVGYVPCIHVFDVHLIP